MILCLFLCWFILFVESLDDFFCDVVSLAGVEDIVARLREDEGVAFRLVVTLDEGMNGVGECLVELCLLSCEIVCQTM